MEARHNGHFRKLLVGYDGSPESERALETALALAQSLGSTVLVLSVARPPEPATSPEVHAVIDEAREYYEKALANIRARALENGLQVETAFAVGHPAQQIIHTAEQDHVDLILVGQRGISGVQRIFLGSVSEQVLHQAPCPVMVTR
jgi:nucleotide-binding universal stress UspA family protein